MGKRAFLVVGPEASGTRLLTRILLAAGCSGCAEHRQPFDETPPRDEALVAWRRSVPHDGQWPDLAGMIGLLRERGYWVQAVVIGRDPAITVVSQVRAGHAALTAQASAQVERAWPLIFELYQSVTPFVLTSYEALVFQSQSARALLALLGLAYEGELPELWDGNEKYW